MCLGYIPDIGLLSKGVLMKHLVTRTTYTKTSAEKAIRLHKRLLEREYWDLCFTTLKQYAETGVKMYILGKGICNVFPILAYCIGDDPALHRYTGVYEGNALHSCIFCKYSVKKDGLFNPLRRVVRDANVIPDLCQMARQGELKKASLIPTIGPEKAAMEALKGQCLHNLPNACWGVPMGYTAPGVPNHVFRCPCDILHTFECGICKNVALWTISLIMAMTSVKEYSNSVRLVDARIASFQDLTKLPNVTQTYFLKGISFIQSNKSAADKTKSTGGAGGFRSAEFIPLLIQLYFCIGVDGAVLPNTANYLLPNGRICGNITKTVLTCISKVLDCAFSMRISPMTAWRSQCVQEKMMDMSKHFIALYQLMNICSGKDPRLPLSRKLHAACCNVTPFSEIFGPPCKGDTAAMESVHREMTVGSWNRTSKRYDGQNEEMAKQAMQLNFNGINSFIHAVTSQTLEDFIIKEGPYIAPTHVIINGVNNTSIEMIHIDKITDNLMGERLLLDALLASVKVNVGTLSKQFKEFCGNECWDALKLPLTPPSLIILQSISIEGNKESRLGKVILHATYNFRNSRPRHDFVMIQHEDWRQPAQLLLLFEMKSFNQLHSQFLAYVRYLTPVPHREETKPMYQCPFPRFALERGPGGRGFQQDFIDVSTIVGPAFITPVFVRNVNLPCCDHPSTHDRWWHIDRQYCDRAGWDEIQAVERQQQIVQQQAIDIHIPLLDDLNLYEDDDYVDSNSESGSSEEGNFDENEEED